MDGNGKRPRLRAAAAFSASTHENRLQGRRQASEMMPDERDAVERSTVDG